MDEIPEKPLEMVKEFPLVYIEWRTFNDVPPKNFPPQKPISQEVRKKFESILDTKLGLDFSSKFHNLTAISLDWKIKNGFYIEEPAIVFYVIRKGVFPTGDKSLPIVIDDLKTDIREGFYDPTVKPDIDCCKYKYPVSIGCSIGIGETRTGTLGAFVQDSNKCIYLLSNDHIIRLKHDSNDPTFINQPSHMDHIVRIENDLKKELYELQLLIKEYKQPAVHIDDKEILENKAKILDDSKMKLEKWRSLLNETDNEKDKETINIEIKILKKTLEKIKFIEEDLEHAKNLDIQLAIFTKGMRGNHNINGVSYGVDAAIAKIKKNGNKYVRNLIPNNFAVRTSTFETTTLKLPKCLSGKKGKDVNDLENINIFKVGRTTGLTEGNIKEVPMTIICKFLSHQVGTFHSIIMEAVKAQNEEIFPSVRLDRQILVRSKKGLFMDEGDSGCVWFDRDGTVLALGHGTLCIGGIDYAVGSPINAVLSALSSPEIPNLELYL